MSQATTTEVTAPKTAPGFGPGAPSPVAAVPAAPQRSARRPLIVLGGVVAALLLGIGIYALVTAGEETTDDAQVEADVVPLAPRVGGQVLRVRVKDNERVKKDAVIFELDPADYAARVAQADAELATARAQAVAAHAQETVVGANARGGLSTAQAAFTGSGAAVASAEAQIAAARAAISRSEAEARKADSDFQRAKELFAANAVPQERLDNATAARDAADAALVAAKAQLDAAMEQKRGAESRVAEAKGRVEISSPIDAQLAAAKANAELADARVKVAEATLVLANNQLNYTQVTAPADGVVSRVSVHEGQLVQPGQPVAELVPELTYVVANFKETQIGAMKPGQKVELTVDAFAGQEVRGRGGEPLGRHRLALLAAAARQRLGQLREGGAAGAGAHQLGRPAEGTHHARRHVGRRHREGEVSDARAHSGVPVRRPGGG